MRQSGESAGRKLDGSPVILNLLGVGEDDEAMKSKPDPLIKWSYNWCDITGLICTLYIECMSVGEGKSEG